jgi:hypothetical protein
MNNGIGTTAIHLVDGHQIQLKEIVDVGRLRDVAGACLAIYAHAVDAEGAFELPAAPPVTCANEDLVGAYLWGCEKHDLAEPNWTLLPEGIVLGSWANPHSMAARDGHGPILPWAVLKREGLLKADSPVAHLWANVAPAEAAALACSSSFEGSEYRIWREERSP